MLCVHCVLPSLCEVIVIVDWCGSFFCGSSLIVVRCLLFVDGAWLFIECKLLFGFRRGLLITVCCLLIGVGVLLFIVYCLLFDVRCVLVVV